MDPREPMERDPTQIISVETAVNVTVAVRRLAAEAIGRMGPWLRADQEHIGKRAFYFSNLKFFGDLSEWNGRFFSYKDRKFIDEHPEDHIIWIDQNPDQSGEYPDGTDMTFVFMASGLLEPEEVGVRLVAFSGEALPQTQDRYPEGYVEDANVWRRTEWRPLTEGEGEDLLFDVLELHQRLGRYLNEHPNQQYLYPDSF